MWSNLEWQSKHSKSFLIAVKILFSPNLGTESWVCLQHLAEYCEQTHEAWGFCSSPGHWPLCCQHCEARAIADQLQCLFPWLYVHLSMFLEKGMATHSSILAWNIPFPGTEEPDRLQSMGPQRVGYDWATDMPECELGQVFLEGIFL